MSTEIFNTARDLLAFSPLKNAAIRTIFRLADWFGFWRYPADIDVEDLRSFWRTAYWFHVAGNPLVRAQKGSGLEQFFQQQQARSIRIPAGFEGDHRLTLSAAGDLLCNKLLENSQDTFYADVAPILFGADVSFANLESSLTSGKIGETKMSDKDLPRINATENQFDVLKGYQGKNYTIFQTSNNHSLDCGSEGILTTIDRLNAENIRFVGTNRSKEEQEKGTIVETKGIRLGFVAATFGVNGRSVPAGEEYLVNITRLHRHDAEVDLSSIERQIAWCRAQNCDLVILGLHWGFEWEFYPRAHQVDLAHHLAEAGADLIIGHHPHVIQPVEWYQTERDPDRVVPVFYSLGNLVAVVKAPFSALSLVAVLALTKGRINGKTKTLVERCQVIPVYHGLSVRQGQLTAQLSSLSRLVQSTNHPDLQVQATQAGQFADLVLGKLWRQPTA